jgi:hypothetical protein
MEPKIEKHIHIYIHRPVTLNIALHAESYGHEAKECREEKIKRAIAEEFTHILSDINSVLQ